MPQARQYYRRLNILLAFGLYLLVFEPCLFAYADFSDEVIWSAFQESKSPNQNIQEQLPQDVQEDISPSPGPMPPHINGKRPKDPAIIPPPKDEGVANLKDLFKKLIENFKKRPLHEQIALLLLYIGLIGAISIFITWIVSLIPKIKGMEVIENDNIREAVAKNKPPTGDSILRQADMLFEEKKYSEAVDAIFFGIINLIKYQLNKNIRPSMTSREMLIKISLSQKIRFLLTQLVDKVELIRFGRRPASSEDYIESRSFFCQLIAEIVQ